MAFGLFHKKKSIVFREETLPSPIGKSSRLCYTETIEHIGRPP